MFGLWYLGVLHIGNKLHHPLWQVCNHSWRCCILCNYHAHGAGGKKWCTDWWITFKVVHQLCVCVQWTCLLIWNTFSDGSSEILCYGDNPSSEELRFHLKINCVCYWDKYFVFLTCCSAARYMLIVIQSLTPVGMCYADKTQKKGNNSTRAMHFTHIGTTESPHVSIKITYQSNANAYLWWPNFKRSCRNDQLYVCVQQIDSPKADFHEMWCGGF